MLKFIRRDLRPMFESSPATLQTVLYFLSYLFSLDSVGVLFVHFWKPCC